MGVELALGQNGLPLPNLGDPTFEGQRIFVVTLKNFEDNESFYSDMEGADGTEHIPKREVNCNDRRPKERNVEYLLTVNEATKVAHDPRVAAIELNPDDLGLVITRNSWVSNGTFSKAIALTSTDIDWGLFRMRAKTNPSGWGATGFPTLLSTTVISDTSGKNVDVVVMDGGTPYPDTLEYAQYSNGTGYPRAVLYNWLYGTGDYSYSFSNGHQAHTSGTAAGNKQGLARDANLYNLTFNDPYTYIIDFHKNKAINPLTGLKNPTVTNHSYGYGGSISSYSLLKLNTSLIHYRGVDYFPTSGGPGSYVWSDATIQGCGIPSQFGNGWPDRNSATDANFIDGAKAGIINVCSAGNNFFFIAKPSSDPNDEYNNYLVYSGTV